MRRQLPAWQQAADASARQNTDERAGAVRDDVAVAKRQKDVERLLNRGRWELSVNFYHAQVVR